MTIARPAKKKTAAKRSRPVKAAIPAIARGVLEGKSNLQISRECGISDDSVARVMGDAEFAREIQLLAQRIVKNTSDPDILKAGLKDRMFAVGIAIDKARLLKNEPTEIVSGGGRVNVLIARLQSLRIGSDRMAEITDGGRTSELDIETEPAGAEGTRGEH